MKLVSVKKAKSRSRGLYAIVTLFQILFRYLTKVLSGIEYRQITLANQANFPFYDRSLLTAIILILVFGMIMVQSSSVVLVNAPSVIIFKYIMILCVSLVFFICPLFVSSKFWEGFIPYFLLIVVFMLIAVLIIGIEKNGARRWINLGVVSLQPAELAKLAIIIYFARFLKESSTSIQGDYGIRAFFKEIFPYFLILGITTVLMLMQPDRGAIVSIVVISAAVLVTCGIRMSLFTWGFVVFIVGVGLIAYNASYIVTRLSSYLDPFADPYNKGYQTINSLISFGRGGIWGQGLGNSISKFHYLTEVNTDFIFAIIGEELGIFGILLTAGLYLWILKRLSHIAYQSIFVFSRKFQGYLVLGIIYFIAYQFLYNMGMVTNLLPVDGLTLPLISYGGTSYSIYLLALGICLRIDSENRYIAFKQQLKNQARQAEKAERRKKEKQPNVTDLADRSSDQSIIRIN